MIIIFNVNGNWCISKRGLVILVGGTASLRGVVRAAPEVILIGEIRDREGMEAAINF